MRCELEKFYSFWYPHPHSPHIPHQSPTFHSNFSPSGAQNSYLSIALSKGEKEGLSFSSNRILLSDYIALARRVRLLEEELQQILLQQLIAVQTLRALPVQQGRYPVHRVGRIAERVVLAHPELPIAHVHHQDYAVRGGVRAEGSHYRVLGWKSKWKRDYLSGL